MPFVSAGTPWKLDSGGPTSVTSSWKRYGTTRDSSPSAFDSAPASNISHREPRFSGVRQITPKRHSSSALVSTEPQLAPAWIDSSETNTSSPWNTFGSQSAIAVAMVRLRSPDQLTKTFIEPRSSRSTLPQPSSLAVR